MTKQLPSFLILIIFIAVLHTKSHAQEIPSPGIHFSRGVAYTSQVSSNIGSYCNATGWNSFAGGYQSQAQGSCSFAFGNTAQANASSSISLGFFVTASQDTCVVIGSGINANQTLTASVSGITMGMGSTHPTLFLSKAIAGSRTGRVAIGNVTPQAKLHIRSDADEDAGIILEPAAPTSNSTFINLHDDYHYINVNRLGEMSLSAGSGNALGITSFNINVEGGLMHLGTSYNNLYLSAEDTPSVSSNAYPYEGDYYSFTQGPSYTLEFGDTGVRLRTATNTIPRERNLIENWRDALSVKTNGAITLRGKVGINIENIYPGYALAVDGGVITTKVHIQDVNEWQDRVFGKDYDLMPLEDLEAYVSANRHLPGVPSEAEVRANGFDVAEMQAVLLGKIEEMTLHVIRQQKEIDSLRTLVSVHFGYDACGNRVSRTLEFARMEDPGKDGDDDTAPNPEETSWQAELSDRFEGVETTLSPNPTDGGFILSMGGEISQGAKAILCTMDGKVLEERSVNNATEEFDLSGKPAGIYLLRLSSERETKVWKVVKRN